MLDAVMHACNSSAEEMASAAQAGYCVPGITSVGLTRHFHVRSGQRTQVMAMWQLLSVELSAQPSGLLLKHSLIMIHEVCLLFK